jgi:rhodanese-related sulfurtransferase
LTQTAENTSANLPWSEISVTEAAEIVESGNRIRLIDVRESHEFAICSIAGSIHMPLSAFRGDGSDDVGEKSGVILVVCHHGVRSLMAARYFDKLGYEDVRSIAGGIDRWAIEVSPDLPRY